MLFRSNLYNARGNSYTLTSNLHINGQPWRQQYFFNVQNNGTLGTWSTYGTSLPGTLSYSQAIVTNGYVYLLGGNNGSSIVSTVYYAPINSNGTLGTWSTGTSLPGALGYSQAIVTNGYVYLLGGYNGSSYTSTIYYISFNGGLNNYLNNIYLPGSNSSYFNVPYYPQIGRAHV